MQSEPPRHDEPMVILVMVVEYKVERVLIDQGSSANILYWSTYKKLGLKLFDMEPYARKLYGFVGDQVEIKGVTELETTFGECSYVRTILVLYTVINMEASYNEIMGWPTLNKLGAVVSTYHLCMKVWVDHQVTRRCYEDSLRIGSRPSQADEPNVNVLDLDLDLRCDDERKRPLLAEDLKEVNIGTKPKYKTKIGTALEQEDESNLISFLRENRDVFVWSPVDMPEIDPKFICHHLSISPGFQPVTQRRWKLGDEKQMMA
ncbi:hypothetical protein CR513_14103, partial [Mucuna pruriens]